MGAKPVISAAVLAWEYPAGDDQPFVLRAGGEIVGWLRFVEDAAEASTAEFGARLWTFRRAPGLHGEVSIYAFDSGQPVARYAPGLAGGGVVTFAAGPHYTWSRHDILAHRWCFRRQEDRSSVCLTQRAGPLTKGAKVTVCRDAARLPETPVLLMLAWYLRVLAFQLDADGIANVG